MKEKEEGLQAEEEKREGRGVKMEVEEEMRER